MHNKKNLSTKTLKSRNIYKTKRVQDKKMIINLSTSLYLHSLLLINNGSDVKNFTFRVIYINDVSDVFFYIKY